MITRRVFLRLTAFAHIAAAEGIALEQYAEAYKFIDEQGDNIMKVMIDL